MPLAKEAGYVVSIDQASNLAGVSLWKDGVLQATTVLRARSPRDGFGARLVEQVLQLTEFFEEQLSHHEQVKTMLFEGVKSSQVLATVGAFVCCPYLKDNKFSPRNCFVPVLSWKKWCRNHGATEKRFGDIKGVKALADTGWDFKKFPIDSDDIADSILIYCAWRDYR